MATDPAFKFLDGTTRVEPRFPPQYMKTHFFPEVAHHQIQLSNGGSSIPTWLDFLEGLYKRDSQVLRKNDPAIAELWNNFTGAIEKLDTHFKLNPNARITEEGIANAWKTLCAAKGEARFTESFMTPIIADAEQKVAAMRNAGIGFTTAELTANGIRDTAPNKVVKPTLLPPRTPVVAEPVVSMAVVHESGAPVPGMVEKAITEFERRAGAAPHSNIQKSAYSHLTDLQRFGQESVSANYFWDHIEGLDRFERGQNAAIAVKNIPDIHPGFFPNARAPFDMANEVSEIVQREYHPGMTPEQVEKAVNDYHRAIVRGVEKNPKEYLAQRLRGKVLPQPDLTPLEKAAYVGIPLDESARALAVATSSAPDQYKPLPEHIGPTPRLSPQKITAQFAAAALPQDKIPAGSPWERAAAAAKDAKDAAAKALQDAADEAAAKARILTEEQIVEILTPGVTADTYKEFMEKAKSSLRWDNIHPDLLKVRQGEALSPLVTAQQHVHGALDAYFKTHLGVKFTEEKIYNLVEEYANVLDGLHKGTVTLGTAEKGHQYLTERLKNITNDLEGSSALKLQRVPVVVRPALSPLERELNLLSTNSKVIGDAEKAAIKEIVGRYIKGGATISPQQMKVVVGTLAKKDLGQLKELADVKNAVHAGHAKVMAAARIAEVPAITVETYEGYLQRATSRIRAGIVKLNPEAMDQLGEAHTSLENALKYHFEQGGKALDPHRVQNLMREHANVLKGGIQFKDSTKAYEYLNKRLNGVPRSDTKALGIITEPVSTVIHTVEGAVDLVPAVVEKAAEHAAVPEALLNLSHEAPARVAQEGFLKRISKGAGQLMEVVGDKLGSGLNLTKKVAVGSFTHVAQPVAKAGWKATAATASGLHGFGSNVLLAGGLGALGVLGIAALSSSTPAVRPMRVDGFPEDKIAFNGGDNTSTTLGSIAMPVPGQRQSTWMSQLPPMNTPPQR